MTDQKKLDEAFDELEFEDAQEPELDDEDDICSACNGSGEGMYDGSTCYKCKGCGHEPGEQNNDGECYDID